MIYQRQEKGCGFACIKMALAHYAQKPAYANLSEPSIYGQAPSLRELMAFSSAHGLSLKAYRVERKQRLYAYLKEPVLAM
ncbi:MAG: hypothetical protein J5736_02810, partial [Bacilli bacterium]|nr:hypothetical protein [Bacilli bacterium]